MDTKDLNGPAPGEQSGKKIDDTGDTEKQPDLKISGNPEADPEKSGPDTGIQKDLTEDVPPVEGDSSENPEEVPPVEGDPSENPEDVPPLEDDPSENPEDLTPVEDDSSEAGAGSDPGKSSDEKSGSETDKSSDEKSSDQPESNTGIKPVSKTGETSEQQGTPGTLGKSKPDYQTLSKEELLNVLRELIDSDSVNSIREEVEAIKVSFYKRHKAEIEQKRKRFMQEGGDVEDFDPGEDQEELIFKELYRKYRHSKAALNRGLEKTRQGNLEEKLKVIEDLKDLVNRHEDVNLTFSEFRQLQKRWHDIGSVPQQNLKDLWDTYHHYVETFYDQIKINKELRDLDLKKNFEIKTVLCEKAEELLLEPNIIRAFRQLQKFHDQWRETGPVPRDQKDVLWERFREVTHKINKKHQEHFDNLKESQKQNLDTKIRLCEKADSMIDMPFDNFQKVDKLSKEMIALQRTWKTIGFAPRKDNNKIYQRFRNACDKFFARKREFNLQNKEYMNENFQKKLDFCMQAEALRDSADWKTATDELIRLQQKWKEIGPVPRKHYDPLWKRFRSACDHFFKRKSEYFDNMDSKYEENLRKKNELIEKIENLNLENKVEENLKILKDFQREWATIGFVPIKEKDTIQKRYRAALDKNFEGLKIDDQKKNLLKFRHKLEGVTDQPNSYNKLKFEREKFVNRFKQLENDITLWENNIGFFAKSKSAEATISEFRNKIEQGKKQMDILEEKIRMIDEMDND